MTMLSSKNTTIQHVYLNSKIARFKLKEIGVKKNTLWIMSLNSIIHANCTDS